jgi:DNA-binding transcriptional regulator YbjK
MGCREMAGPDRRSRIADAVIATLATRGSRGLTHRAVDEAAGLPPGSTSYYHRSRAELLRAAVPRLLELDGEALMWRPGQALDALLLQILDRSRRGAGRARTLARYELVLEGARRPELRAELGSGTERLVALLVAEFPALADGKDLGRARDVLAFLDGLLLAEVTSPQGQRRKREELEETVTRFVGAITSPQR